MPNALFTRAATRCLPVTYCRSSRVESQLFSVHVADNTAVCGEERPSYTVSPTEMYKRFRMDASSIKCQSPAAAPVGTFTRRTNGSASDQLVRRLQCHPPPPPPSLPSTWPKAPDSHNKHPRHHEAPRSREGLVTPGRTRSPPTQRTFRYHQQSWLLPCFS